MKPDEIVVSFMNARTRKDLSELPDEVVVLTELVKDGEIVVAPKDEFLEWLNR